MLHPPAQTYSHALPTKRKIKLVWPNKEKINFLLFMDDLKFYAKNEKGLETLGQTIQIFSDIGMQFDIDKCATLVLKRGGITKFEGIS